MKKVCGCEKIKEDKSIEKPRPIINKKQMEIKFANNPMYQIFGESFINHNLLKK
jgi:hypothetical protein